jgi:hypothetical protein
MKLKKYKALIDKLVEEGHGERVVIFATDEEGNRYEDVFYGPTVINAKNIETYQGKGKGKVICIN